MSVWARSAFPSKLLPRPRALLFLAALLVAIAAVAALIWQTRPEKRFALKLVRVENFLNSPELAGAPTKRVTLELRKLAALPFNYGYAQQMRVRVAGQWQAPVTLKRLGDVLPLVRTNREELVVTVPANSEACRLLMEYRADYSPYTQAYFFLSRLGLYQKFPALCRWMIKGLTRQPQLRHVELELTLPIQATDQLGGATRPEDRMLDAISQPTQPPAPTTLAITRQ